nr:unnamed protein product [Digitaria exilis]
MAVMKENAQSPLQDGGRRQRDGPRLMWMEGLELEWLVVITEAMLNFWCAKRSSDVQVLQKLKRVPFSWECVWRLSGLRGRCFWRRTALVWLTLCRRGRIGLSLASSSGRYASRLRC